MAFHCDVYTTCPVLAFADYRLTTARARAVNNSISGSVVHEGIQASIPSRLSNTFHLKSDELVLNRPGANPGRGVQGVRTTAPLITVPFFEKNMLFEKNCNPIYRYLEQLETRFSSDDTSPAAALLQLVSRIICTKSTDSLVDKLLFYEDDVLRPTTSLQSEVNLWHRKWMVQCSTRC